MPNNIDIEDLSQKAKAKLRLRLDRHQDNERNEPLSLAEVMALPCVDFFAWDCALTEPGNRWAPEIMAKRERMIQLYVEFLQRKPLGRGKARYLTVSAFSEDIEDYMNAAPEVSLVEQLGLPAPKGPAPKPLVRRI